MTARGWWIGAAGVLAVAISLWVRWPELLAVGVGLLSLLLVPVVLRFPVAASWSDVSAPVRVVRGDPAEVVVAVTVPAGSTRWVSAVDDLESDRVFLPFASATGDLVWSVDTSRRVSG